MKRFRRKRRVSICWDQIPMMIQVKTVFNIRSDVLVLTKGQSDFNLVAKHVAHFMLDCLHTMENIHQLLCAQQLCMTCQPATMEKLLHRNIGIYFINVYVWLLQMTETEHAHVVLSINIFISSCILF